MDDDLATEFRRPLVLAALGFALLGWIIAGWSLINASSEAGQAADQIAALRRQNDQVSGDLKTLRSASGSLSDTLTASP